MKHLYNSLTSISIRPVSALLAVMALLSVAPASAQVRVNFTRRTDPQNLKVRGDFSMIGNTNLRLVNYSDDQNNSVNMEQGLVGLFLALFEFKLYL